MAKNHKERNFGWRGARSRAIGLPLIVMRSSIEYSVSPREKVYFSPNYSTLSLSLSSSPRYSLDFFYFFSPFLIFFENRSRLKSGCLSRILKLLIQLVFSIKGDKIFLHDGFSTQVSRYTRTTYFSLSFSLFQVYMYVFLLSISFERKKNIGYKTNERIYNIDKKEENEEKGIYFSPNLVIKEELCNSYDTRFAWFCVVYDASWIELPWTFFSKSIRSLKERKGLIFWSRIFTHIAYLFYRLKWLNILTNSNELLAR